MKFKKSRKQKLKEAINKPLQRIRDLERARIHRLKYIETHKENRFLMFKRISREAVRRNKPFELTIEQFIDIMSNPCVYCGEPPRGLDRVDNTLGYLIDNVVPCCGMCNRMKYTATLDEFKAKVIQIYNHLGLK